MSTAVYCAPVMAPAAAPALGVTPAAVGYFVTVVYLGSMIGTVTAGGWVGRFGPILVSQAGLLLCLAGLAVAASGSLPAVLVGALLLGLGYGPATPASSVILARTAPPHLLALMFSIKQTGVPLGTAIAGAAVPLMVLALGWQAAALAIGIACALCAAALAPIRGRYDAGRNPAAPASIRSAFAPVALIVRDRTLLELSLVSFIYGGMQITLLAYLVTFLVESFSLSLVLAGMVMAASQLTSVAARIGWGLFADRIATRRATLGLLGIGMGLTAITALAASPAWPLWALFAFAMAYGATAVGWNGVFLAEIARRAPRDRISDATGGSAFFTFLGVVVTPPLFHLVLVLTGSYGATYAIFGVPALAAGLRLLLTAKIARDATHS
ncbi:MAG TPA: MFS transporter [Burkholderiales bacterium]